MVTELLHQAHAKSQIARGIGVHDFAGEVSAIPSLGHEPTRNKDLCPLLHLADRNLGDLHSEGAIYSSDPLTLRTMTSTRDNRRAEVIRSGTFHTSRVVRCVSGFFVVVAHFAMVR